MSSFCSGLAVTFDEFELTNDILLDTGADEFSFDLTGRNFSLDASSAPPSGIPPNDILLFNLDVVDDDAGGSDLGGRGGGAGEEDLKVGRFELATGLGAKASSFSSSSPRRSKAGVRDGGAEEKLVLLLLLLPPVVSPGNATRSDEAE